MAKELSKLFETLPISIFEINCVSTSQAAKTIDYTAELANTNAYNPDKGKAQPSNFHFGKFLTEGVLMPIMMQGPGNSCFSRKAYNEPTSTKHKFRGIFVASEKGRTNACDSY